MDDLVRQCKEALGNRTSTVYFDTFTKIGDSQVVLAVKKLPANAGGARDAGWIPGLEKFPWSRKWQPTQHSRLENFMDRGVWLATVHGATKVGHRGNQI